MKFILTLSAAALAVSATMTFAQTTVRLATEGAYPPYNFINDNGDVDGMEREFGDELCARAELNCEWVTNDWDTIIPGLVSGNYDAILAGMSITDERKEVIDFTQAYYPPAPSAYAALSDDIDTVDGVIAAQTGTLQASHVAEAGAALLEFASPDDTVAAVRNGEADAVLADKDFLAAIVAESDLIFVGDDVLLGDGIGVGMRKSDTALREKFDAAIDSMKADGTLNAMLIKWFGDDTKTY